MALKKAIFILVVVGFAVLFYVRALTQKDLPSSGEAFSPPTWDWKVFAASPEVLDRLCQTKLERGLRNVPILSFALIREAERTRRRGELERAIEIARYAVQFSPDLPDPHFELARQKFYRNCFQLPDILSDVYRGAVAQFRCFPSSLRLLYNFFFIFSNAILLSFAVFGMMVMVKYLPLYFYDIQARLTREVPNLLMNSLKIFLLFIPLLLRLDMLWAVLFWSILMWGYVPGRERRVILFFFLAVVYLPFLLRSSSSLLDSSSFEVLLDVSRANYEEWDGTTEERLQTWLSAHPDDSDVLFTLGLTEKRQGRHSKAQEFYQRAIQFAPKFDEAFSNLGNVYLIGKQTDRAIASYQAAIDLSPDKGAYYYNLYRAYSQETFFSRNLDWAYRRARQLDPVLVDYYSGIDVSTPGAGVNGLVIDEVLPINRFWKRFLTEFLGGENTFYRLFKVWFERIPSRIPYITALLFLLFFIVVWKVTRRRQYPARCPMCGIPTHRLHLESSNRESLCVNCYRIFFKKEKLHPRIEERKLLQARRFQGENRFVERFLSFFLVGFGYLWGEHLLKGFLLLSLFFVFLLRFAFWNGVILSPFFQTENLWTPAFWGGAFIIFYLLSTWRIYRIKPRFKP